MTQMNEVSNEDTSKMENYPHRDVWTLMYNESTQTLTVQVVLPSGKKLKKVYRNLQEAPKGERILTCTCSGLKGKMKEESLKIFGFKIINN